jgi:hypothetical protein
MAETAHIPRMVFLRSAIEVMTLRDVRAFHALNPEWAHPGFEKLWAYHADGDYHTLFLVPIDLMPPRDAPTELPPAV